MQDKITINLHDSRDAKEYDLENAIQQEALQKCMKIIFQNEQDALVYDPNIKFVRKHETITIHGARGTGKTSFILSLPKIIKNENNSIMDLGVLDPTLFEDKQNIVLTIISLIQEKVNDFFNKNENYESKPIKEKWGKNLFELAEGLNLLDGIGNNPLHKDYWDDAKLILEKDLISAYSGRNFEKNLHKFIHTSLDILNKKMFLLAFDDIDTSFMKGWPVLEVIRKYLTTPQMQILLSGDWELYSKLVRKQQWNNLGDLIHNEPSSSEYKGMVDRLEEQYLIKILKPENRINLKSLNTLLDERNQMIFIHDKESDISLNILEIYQDICEKIFFLTNEAHIQLHKSILATLAIRTNIQLFIAYFIYLKTKNTKIFIHVMSDIFSTKLNRQGFKVNEIKNIKNNNSLNFLILKLMEFTEKNGALKLNDIYQLFPIFNDENLNILLLTLSAYYTRLMQENPQEYLLWDLKIEQLFQRDFEFSSDDSVRKLRYLGFHSQLSASDIAVKINGLFHDEKEVEGFAQVYIHQSVVNKRDLNLLAYNTFLKSIMEDFTDKPLLQFLTKIMFANIRTKKNSETNTYGSVHYILAFISDLISNKDDISQVFESISNERTITAFASNNDASIYYSEAINLSLENLSIHNELNMWLTLVSKIESLPPYILSNIWQEFHTQEQAIWKANVMGEFLKAQIYILLNSFLRGIQKYKNPDKKFQIIFKNSAAESRFKTNIEHANYSDTYEVIKSPSYSSSLEKFIEKRKEIDLFEFMLLCPLWNYYINFARVIQISSNKLLIPDVLLDGNETTFFDLLNLVLIRFGSQDTNQNDDNEIEFKNDFNSMELLRKNMISSIFNEANINVLLETLDLNNPEEKQKLVVIVWNELKIKYPKYWKGKRLSSHQEDIENVIDNLNN